MEPIVYNTGYQPGGQTLDDLKSAHTNIKFLKSATTKIGVKLKANQWVRLESGKIAKILAFDRYNLPLPLDKGDRPLGVYSENGFTTTVYKQKYRKIKRAIYYDSICFIFSDIDAS